MACGAPARHARAVGDEFVDSAAAALEALEATPYDAIVTDMRMPEMDGAQLLEQVKQRYPDVIRVVLSGQASRAAVLRSIAPAHQFLSKPCDPQELASPPRPGLCHARLLSNQSLKTIVSRLRSIPSLPTIYDELTVALRSREDPSISRNRTHNRERCRLWPSRFCNWRTRHSSAHRGRVSSLLQAAIYDRHRDRAHAGFVGSRFFAVR